MSEKEGIAPLGEEVLRPVVSKSLVKGTIGVAVFSVFLQINLQQIGNYLIFLAICYIFIGLYMFQKHQTTYVLKDYSVEIHPFLRAPKEVSFSDVRSVSIAQGFLAKRFDCGTVFLDLSRGRGSVRAFGGGIAEALRDVKMPKKIVFEISSKIPAPDDGT